jgi:DNA-binding HxlR family transcriptional regulator
MATKRTYGDGCSIARGLDFVGERWALLIVRELLLGPKRFTDLRKGLRKASPNVLSQRLDELEQAGVIQRRTLPPPAAARVYELTDWGLELEDVVMALGGWAARSPGPPSDAPIVSPDSVVLALRARFDPAAAPASDARYELRFGEDRFGIEVVDGELRVARGNLEDADVTIATDTDTLNAVLWGDQTLAQAQRSGALTVEGDEAAAKRFVQLFPMPEQAVAVSA